MNWFISKKWFYCRLGIMYQCHLLSRVLLTHPLLSNNRTSIKFLKKKTMGDQCPVVYNIQ